MSDKAFVGYEYQEVAVKNGMTSVYADGYENFGWKLEKSDVALGKPDSVIMKFKRDRKIRNKPELTRLQRQFDAIVSEIVSDKSLHRRFYRWDFGDGIHGRFRLCLYRRPAPPQRDSCSPCVHRLDRPLFPLPFHGEEKDRIRHPAD